jgi:hypothetical protein
VPGTQGPIMMIAAAGITPFAGNGTSSPPSSRSPWVSNIETRLVLGEKFENAKAGELESDLQVATPAHE